MGDQWQMFPVCSRGALGPCAVLTLGVFDPHGGAPASRTIITDDLLLLGRAPLRGAKGAAEKRFRGRSALNAPCPAWMRVAGASMICDRAGRGGPLGRH